MATCGTGRGQVGGMTTAAADGNGNRGEETTSQRGSGRARRGGVVFRRGRGGGRGRGRGTTIEEDKEKNE